MGGGLLHPLLMALACAGIARVKKFPVVLWTVLGLTGGIFALVIVGLAPASAGNVLLGDALSPGSPAQSASPVLGWLLLAAGVVLLPISFIGLGFSNPGEQRTTMTIGILLSIAGIVTGVIFLRRARSESVVNATSSRSIARPRRMIEPERMKQFGAVAVGVAVLGFGRAIGVNAMNIVRSPGDSSLYSSLGMALIPLVLAGYIAARRDWARVILLIVATPLSISVVNRARSGRPGQSIGELFGNDVAPAAAWILLLALMLVLSILPARAPIAANEDRAST